MGRKANLGAERLRELARQAVQKAKSKIIPEGIELSCEYLDENIGAAVTRRTEVKFEWHVKWNEFEE